MKLLCRLQRLSGRIVTMLAILAVLWAWGLIWFAETIPRQAAAANRRTDAIVVLTGGSDRLETGIELLSRGMGRKLFVSGVHQGVGLDELLRAAKLPEGDLACCVVLGHLAGDTVGNASETAAWLQAEGYRSLRLVTANYHMRRSLLEFRTALPDVDIVAHPVAPQAVRLSEWWRWPGTLTLIATEYNKFLVALARYWIGVGFGAGAG